MLRDSISALADAAPMVAAAASTLAASGILAVVCAFCTSCTQVSDHFAGAQEIRRSGMVPTGSRH
jgi:hypothetical protein